ncbi:hypothetical protein [Anabaena azotica]|uniref:hypothetical protein n=1 Tax=Anabaena azotica TaxID=197653 RepID=UPI0039A4263C
MFYNELLIDLLPEEQELLSGGQSTPTSGSPTTKEGSSPNGESEKQKDQFTFIPLIVLLPVATISALANSQNSKKET